MAYKSPYDPVQIPNIDLWEFLLAKPNEYPEDKVLFLDSKTSRHYTFKTLQQSSLAFGRALQKQWNWQQGETICIYCPNSVDTPMTIMGALSIGAVVTLASSAYSASELALQMKDSDSKAIVTQVSCLATVFEAVKISGIPRNRILLIGDEPRSEVHHVLDFMAYTSEGSSLSKRQKQNPESLAFLVYSSGTTGLPKGVMLTHRNIVANTLMMNAGDDPIGPTDTITGVLPFAHIAGLALEITQVISRGAKVIVQPSFDLVSYLQIIHDHKVTFTHVVPPIVLLLAKSPLVAEYDLSSLRMASSAAAPLTRDLIEELWDRRRIPCRQAYGLSECSPGVSVQRPSEWRSSIGSAGKLGPNQSMRIMSPSGEPVPKGCEGEILLKGPNVFAGYHKNPTATEACMTPDGYFRTGDIGYVDTTGNIWITDRLKELIKYKGTQVAPAELEGYLISHPKVADACVVGVEDPEQATELPRAYIVKAESAKGMNDKFLELEISEWLEGKVASYKKLRGGIRFVHAIPKSAAGKILRKILREQAKSEVGREKTMAKL